MSRVQGFTLLEMLLAMLIIAIVGVTLSTAISGVAVQSFALERRAMAHWIAQNQVHRMRIALHANPQVLPEGKDSTRIIMGARDWELRTTVSATDHPLLRRVEIDVFEMQGGERTGPFDHLVAFVGQH